MAWNVVMTVRAGREPTQAPAQPALSGAAA
jgi:hypothetical protein